MSYESSPSKPSVPDNATSSQSSSVTLEQRNQALDRAKALILQGWTQNAFARDEHGDQLNDSYISELKRGSCFCASGACFVVEEKFFGPAWEALKKATVALGYGPSPAVYNDKKDRTKYEVAALFDHAKEQPL